MARLNQFPWWVAAWFGFVLAALWGAARGETTRAGGAEPWLNPSADWALGTDGLGRDVLARVVAGGGDVVLWPLLAGVLTTTVGAACGLLATRVRAVAVALEWGSPALIAAPGMVVSVLLAGLMPAPVACVVTMLLMGAPLSARVIHAAAAPVQASPAVEVATLRGESTWSVLVRDVVPAVAGTLIGDVTSRCVAAMHVLVGLHVLGFGPPPPHADWGLMIRENLLGVTLAPWAVAAPAVAMAVLATLTTLAGDQVSSWWAAAAPKPPQVRLPALVGDGAEGGARFGVVGAVGTATGRGRRAGGTDVAVAAGVGAVPGGEPGDGADGVVVRGVTIRHRGEVVLSVTELRCGRGKLTAVVGPSGAGKSTLLGLLAGSPRPGAAVTAEPGGGVTLAGRAYPQTAVAARRLRREVVAWCDQHAVGTLPRTHRVWQAVADGRGVPQAACEAVLAQVGLGPEVAEQRCSTLSGGQAARVAVARALVGDPQVLLLDEPTAGLDAASGKVLGETLRAVMAERGVTVVVVTHDEPWVAEFADAVASVAHGVVRSAGRPVTGQQGGPVGRVRQAQVSSDVVPVLQLRGVTLSHGDRRVVSGLNVTVHRGELVVLVGPSGAGKSTVLRSLVGLHPTTSGEVLWQDAPLPMARAEGQPARRPQRMRQAIQWVPQDSSGALTPTETARGAVLRAACRWHGGRERAESWTDGACMSAHLGADWAKQRVAGCSGGQRQRIGLARALVGGGDLLVADEPTAALDAEHTALVVAALRRECQRGATVVAASHDPVLIAEADVVIELTAD